MRKALGQFSILLALILGAGLSASNAIEGAAPAAASRPLPAGLLRAIQETLGQTPASGTFKQQQELTNNDIYFDGFGSSVALSSNGTVALIGAPDDTNSLSGAAYVFTKHSDTWTEQQELKASDGAPSDFFGTFVALSSDGSTALIGAANHNGGFGAAYIFTEHNNTWTQQQELQASDAVHLGTSVTLSGNGSIALIGADDAAYVFAEHGGIWTEQQQLKALDHASGDGFGNSVALSSDGSIALIGAPYATANSQTGAAYIFTEHNNTWTQQQELQDPSPAVKYDFFGTSVALGSDGSIALIGAPGKNSKGAAYVFTEHNNIWTDRLWLHACDGAPGDHFGGSVALSSDGSVALIGAQNKYTWGAAYVFTQQNNIWTEQQELQASDHVSGDLFGESAALSGSGQIALIGAPIHGRYGTGAAYLFTQ